MLHRLFSIKNLLGFGAIALLFLNVVAFFHAYKFTHFSDARTAKTRNPHQLSLTDKVWTLIVGINNPKPLNTELPKYPFKTLYLSAPQKIECWLIEAPESKGTVAIFHGFSGCKSMMLDRAEELYLLGYSTLLVDFIGSGGSDGNQTSLGFHEAETVKICFDYLTAHGEQNVILYGGSMGAAAVLKALSEYTISPSAAIVECPFGSLRETTYARFRQMHVPPFPMADLLMFWGGVQQGFWAFGHNPKEYAKNITMPVLVMYGGQDKEVSQEEISQIFANLRGQKALHIYPHARHESYLNEYRSTWRENVENFFRRIEQVR